MIDEKALEAVARALCIQDGYAPDSMTPNPPPGEWPSQRHPKAPYWRVYYARKASVAILAYEAAKPVAEEASNERILHAHRLISAVRELRDGEPASVHYNGRTWRPDPVPATPSPPMSTSGEMVESVARIVSRVMGRDNHALAMQTAHEIIYLLSAEAALAKGRG